MRHQVGEVCCVNCLFAEFDAKAFAGSMDATRARVDSLPLKPTAIICSGHGYHCYWLLREPLELESIEVRERAARRQAWWVEVLGADEGAKDLARILRVPGTMNAKPGLPPVRVVVERADGPVYSLAEIDSFLSDQDALPEHKASEQPLSSSDIFGDVEKAAAALRHLKLDRVEDRDQWLKVGLSLRGLGEVGLSLWDTWSRRSAAKYRPGECAKMWPSFRGEVGLGTLLLLAQQDAAEQTGVKARERYSAAELCAMPAPETLWLVEGYMLQGGVSVLFGQGGAGKTTCGLDNALAVCAGGPAMGAKVNQRGAVLYFGSDMSLELYRAMLQDISKGRGVAPPVGFHLDLSPLDLGKRDAADLVAGLALEIDAKLIVFDALYCMLGGLDENSNRDMGIVMSTIRKIARETGAHCNVLAHWNKNELAQTRNRGRGATTIRDAADTTMSLVQGSGPDSPHILELDKSRWEPKPKKASMGLERLPTGGLVVVWGDRVVSADRPLLPARAEEAFLDILREREGAEFTREHLEAMLPGLGVQAGDQTVRDALRLLRATPGIVLGKRGKATTYRWVADQGKLPLEGGDGGG